MATTIIDISNSVYNYSGRYVGYYFYLEVILNSQSTANNTSNITVNHYGQANTSTGGGYSGFTTPSSTITVQGEVKRDDPCDANIPTSGAKVLLGTWTGDVEHNSDGSLSLTVSADYAPNTSSYNYLPKANSLSKTVAVTTIPRASDVSVSNYSITRTTSYIPFYVSSKANFWHQYRWSLGGVTSSWSALGNINNTTTQFAITDTAMLEKLPTATSGSLTIEVATYTDANYQNYIGVKSASATISINTSYIKPTVNLGDIALRSHTDGVSSDITVLVAGYSKAQARYESGGGYGTTKRTGTFNVNVGSLEAYSSGGDNNIYTNTLPSNANNYNLAISAYAVDGRGAASDTVSKSATVYGYTPPTATLRAYRVADSTSTTEDGSGTWVYVTYSGEINSSLGGQNALRNLQCTATGGITGDIVSGQHYQLAETGRAEFTLVCTDKVTTSKAVVTVTSVTYPLDLFDDGSGNVGVGLGSIAKYSGYLTTPLIFTGPDANHKELICDVSKAEIVAQDTTLTTSSTDDAWFSALLKAICVKYPSQQNVLFKGDVAPNSLAHYEVMIYNTSSLSSSGLPLWSRGNYSKQSLLFYMFGTDNGTFFRELVDAKSLSSRSISTKIISDTSINTLDTATFLTWLNNNNLNFNENGTTIVTADARYNGYATAIINKVSHNYGRAIMLSFYNSLMVAKLNNGSWIEGEYVQSLAQDSYNGSKEIFINSGVPFTIELQTYGGAILKGFCQGIGGVLIGLMKQGSTIYARDLMSGQNWGNSYLTFTLNNNVLTIATPLTASNSRFTFEYTCN